MGIWAECAEKVSQGVAPPKPPYLALPERQGMGPGAATGTARQPIDDLGIMEKALMLGFQESLRAKGKAGNPAVAVGRHLPRMQHLEAGGNGPGKLVGVSYEILRAFARLNPWVGAAINIRQREVSSSKWRIVPALDDHKEELDTLRRLVLGARQFPERESTARDFKPQFLTKKMVKELVDATLHTETLTTSDILYRFRLAQLDLLIEANQHAARPRKLLETPNESGDADTWSEILKGMVPDLLTLDSGAIELRRAEAPFLFPGSTALPSHGTRWPATNSKILELAWVDGATIRPCLDAHGRLLHPTPENMDDVAYEQWLEGQRSGLFLRHTLIRFVENPQTDVLFRGYGYSRVENLLMTLMLESHADKSKLEELKRAFYGGFLNLKGAGWQQEDVESLRGYVDEQLQGNRMLPLLAFPDGAEWISTTMQQSSNLSSIEERRLLRERIAAMFEMSPVKLGNTSTTNYAAADTSESASDDGLIHLLDVVDRGVTQWIVRDEGFGGYKFLKYESRPAHQREDETELARLEKELHLGISTVNEIRMQRGDSPIEMGDKPYAYFDEYHKAKGQNDASQGMDGEGGEGYEEEEEDGDDWSEEKQDRTEQSAEGGSPQGNQQAQGNRSESGSAPKEIDGFNPEVAKALGSIHNAIKKDLPEGIDLSDVELEISFSE